MKKGEIWSSKEFFKLKFVRAMSN